MFKATSFASFFLFLILLNGSTSAQQLNTENLEARIDSMIPPTVNDTTPGLVIGVLSNGELIYSKGFGLANLAYSITNDSKVVYNIGSVSKQFLGYAFAMLHVEGKLNIDDPVSKYLDPWPEFDQVVTLRHLLTHTSGYREAYTMSNLAGRSVGVDRLSRDECLEVVRRQPELEFTPGSKYVYNSTAWVILAEVLEEVVDMPADQWVSENILKPLEMDNTQIESEVGEVIYNGAESYYEDDGIYTNPKSNRAIFGAAEVYSSIEDMAKWIDNFKTAKVGGEEVNKLFLDSYELNDGSDAGYALGIGIGEYRGAKRYRHTGGHEAFISQLSYFPEYDLGVVMISNFGSEAVFYSSDIVDIMLQDHLTEEPEEELKSIKVKTKKLEELEGFYMAYDYGDWIELEVVNDTLTVDGRNRLIPIGKNVFMVLNRNKTMTVNTEVTPPSLSFSDEPGIAYEIATEWKPDLAELNSFSGDYWIEELEGVYHMTLVDSTLSINHRWMGEMILEHIVQDFFS
ncbi:MAG: serine hydrolase domain-containing protein, partial [Bacteroidota bacterium]